MGKVAAKVTEPQVSGSGRRLVNLKAILPVDRWLYPPVCLICGLAGRSGLDCCEACEAELEWVKAGCRRCGLERVRSVALCGRCTTRLPAFHETHSAFAYRGPIEGLIQRFKFGGDLAAGRVLALLMARRIAEQRWPRPQLMVPVPLHRRRRWWRGFNQSEMLCRDLGRALSGLPWAPVLLRARSTPAQSELPADRRRGNVRGAFRARKLPPGTRHVALVDDVMTTGSTLDECARVLKRAGVSRVDLWVLARA
jgi:ComF family protein